MPFTLIKGELRPQAGIPDGDSVRFKPNKPALLKKLSGRPAPIGTGPETKGTVQLRFEGIDAIEKHATQPLAGKARDNMFRLIGMTAGTPAPRGYILSRMTDDKSGRPIAFLFAGTTSKTDGSEIQLGVSLLKQSVNYLQMRDGFGYPLYYNTLFAELRNQFNVGLAAAKAAHRGYWPTDATRTGVTVRSSADLATIKPIWPKLWRRLEEYFRTHSSLTKFVAFLAAKNERIDVLDVMEERGLQDLVAVSGHRVRLTEAPENLRVRGKAGKRK